MSTSQSSTASCKECDNDLDDFYSPGYCSEDCYHRYQGQKLLNIIENTHTHCANCGVRLKEVEKPPKEFLVGMGQQSAESLVGFQYTTPSAANGEVDVDDTPGREIVSTGTICGECGNTNSSECFPEDRHRHLVEYGHRFLESLEEKRREGVHDKDVDEPVFFEALVESDDLALALGRAIQA